MVIKQGPTLIRVMGRKAGTSPHFGFTQALKDSGLVWNAATLGLFGGKDRGIPAESVQKFDATMKKLGKDVQTHIYPESGHAFENPNNKSGYRAADAADAWKRITDFFAAKLKR